MNVDSILGTPTDVRNDITNLSWTTPRSVSDVTGLDSSAIERILLLADFSLTLNGQFNGAGAHAVLKQVPSTALIRSVSMTVNGVSLSPECLFTDYTVARVQGGDLNWTAAAALGDGNPPAWS